MLFGSVLKYLSVGWLQGPRVPSDALQGTGRRGSSAAGEVGIENRPFGDDPWETIPLVASRLCVSHLNCG